MSKQTTVMDRITNIDLNSQGLGEKFLDYIEDAKRWKADLIRAIHRESGPIGERAQSDPEDISERRKKMQRNLLDSLRFSKMADRHNRIVEAHEKTFQWVFLQRDASQQKWTNFTDWLEGNSTLYWITGKAGSGKSTLMKYVHGDERTIHHLKTWAASVPLVIATFYFWNSGTQMQMSRMGFLQSMLNQVLTEHPTLIPRILPERWEAYNLFGQDDSEWSEPELRQAFRLLTKEDASEAKFCFFIDGLDEFEGDHTDLIGLIKDIGSSSNIKICVSSRPWVLFEDAFRHKPSLMLQDLTYPDIKQFIDDAFYNNLRFSELEEREPEYAGQLLKDIAQKSAGVFLWVTLVVHSLLAGLNNGDRVLDLERRLAFLPPDLESLYEKMLNSLDPFYLEHASQIFQNVRAAKDPPSLLCLSFADEEPEFVLETKVQPLPEKEKLSRADIMRRRLNSRCKGLLEVGPAVSQASEDLEPRDVSLIQRLTSVNDCLAERISPADSTVQYLHRTVKDFLETSQVWDRILLAGPRTYDPYLALCRSFIAQFKCLDTPCRTKTFLSAVITCMRYAHSVQIHLEKGQSAQPLVSLIDEFDRTAAEIHKSSTKDETSWTKDLTESGTFLSLAVRLGLHTYVKAKVHDGCLVKGKLGIWPLLSDAIESTPAFGGIFPFRSFPSVGSFPTSVEMIEMLLKHGADPNREVDSSYGICGTVWKDLLYPPTERARIRDSWTEVIYWFLVYGADPTEDLGTTIRTRLMGLSEAECDRVLAVMKAGRRQIWLRKKNPNLERSGKFKVNFRDGKGFASLPERITKNLVDVYGSVYRAVGQCANSAF